MNDRQTLYQCLENRVTAVSGKDVFLCSASTNNTSSYGIELYIGDDAGDYIDVILINGTGFVGCVRYASITTSGLSLKKSVSGSVDSYYLSGVASGNVTVRKELKYGEFIELLSSSVDAVTTNTSLSLSGITSNFLTNNELTVTDLKPKKTESSIGSPTYPFSSIWSGTANCNAIVPITAENSSIGTSEKKFENIYAANMTIDSLTINSSITGMKALSFGAGILMKVNNLGATTTETADSYNGLENLKVVAKKLTINDADDTTNEVVYDPFGPNDVSIKIDHVGSSDSAAKVNNELSWATSDTGNQEDTKTFNGSEDKKINFRTLKISVPRTDGTQDIGKTYNPISDAVEAQSITINGVEYSEEAGKTSGKLSFSENDEAAQDDDMTFNGSFDKNIYLRPLTIKQISATDPESEASSTYSPIGNTGQSISVNYVEKAKHLDHDVILWGKTVNLSNSTTYTNKIPDSINVSGDLSDVGNINPKSTSSLIGSADSYFGDIYVNRVHSGNIVSNKIASEGDLNIVDALDVGAYQKIRCGKIIFGSDSENYVSSTNYTGTAKMVSNDLTVKYTTGTTGTTDSFTYNGSEPVSITAANAFCTVNGFKMSGNVEMANNSISFSGAGYINLGTSGYILSTSDRRLKKNIKDVDSKLNSDILDSMAKTKVKTYEFKNDESNTEHIGLIAQDLIANFPELKDKLVSKDGKGYYSINTTNLIFVLWDALNAEKARMDDFEKRLSDLER